MKKNTFMQHGLNCPPLAFAALVAFVGCTGGMASAQTVGWWGFEGDPGQTAGIGTVFPNRADASRLPAEVYARYAGLDSTSYQPVFEDPIFGPYAMGDSAMSVVSRSTLRFTNPYADEGRSKGCPVRVQDSNGALDLQTFTLEGWFKMEYTGVNPGWRALFTKGYGSNGSGGYAYTYALYFDSNNNNIRAYFTIEDGNGNIRHLEQQLFVVDNNNAQPWFPDGNWHYVSLVVNGETHKAHLFMDLENGVPHWRGQVDLGGALVYNPAEPLVIGGNNLANWQFCGSVDEVRLSDGKIINTADGALKKRGIPDGTVIGHFPMEVDFKSTVWTNYWADPVLGAATGGETPTFTDLEKKRIRCDKDRVPLGKEIDAKCLTLNKGSVRWLAPELLMACADALTVEFFVSAKTDENQNWASIVRAEYPNDSQNYLPWNISHTTNTAGKDAACRIDTDTSYNTITEYVKIPLDGRWHHLAMQVWRGTNDRNTSFALYVDYEQRATGTAGGWTVYPVGTSFGFGLAGTPFVGRIDEVRLTKGLVPVDDFLRLCGWGPTTLILR